MKIEWFQNLAKIFAIFFWRTRWNTHNISAICMQSDICHLEIVTNPGISLYF